MTTKNATIEASADTAKIEVGDRVLAIGNPFGIGETVTSGIISAKGRRVGILAEVEGFEDFIQTDAAINPGNSGGPLFNASGEVIGINEQIDSQSGGNEGIGFAVPINTAVSVMQQMQNGSFAPQTQDQTQTQDNSGGYLPY